LSKKKLKQINRLNFLFNKLDIKKKDSIILHSNFAGIYQFEKSSKKKLFSLFLNFLIKRIGKDGTLLIPTYNYNFTKGIAYDREKSGCQVGSFGNYLIKNYYENRTFEPIFNHIVFGKLKKEIFNLTIDETFGNKSIFSLMRKKNFKIVCFCCSPNNMTFIHFIEKKMNVRYRFNKYFNGYLKNKKLKKEIKLKYFVGKKKNNYTLKESKILSILDNKNFIEVNYGRFNCYSVTAKYLTDKLKIKINKKNNFLIK